MGAAFVAFCRKTAGGLCTMRKISLRSRIAIVFTIVVTIVLILAAISFSYFCRLHFERKDTQVLASKAYAIENVLLTMEAPYNRIAVPIDRKSTRLNSSH